MRKNYFAKLVKYMKNVYHIEHTINRLRDGRVNPKYKTSQVILPLFLGFLLRIQSMNELKYMLKENEFINVFSRGTKLPKIDTIRNTLKVIELEGLKSILQHTMKKAIVNKVFAKGTIDGYTVGAIDGTKFFGSNKKRCKECLNNINGEKTHSFHSGAVMSIIGDGPKLTAGFEMYKPGKDSTSKDEGELNVAKRLLSDITNSYKSLFDVVVYDALACNSKWINHCIELKIDTVIRAKKNNNKSLRNVKKKVNKQDPIEIWVNKYGTESIKIYESNFETDNVERPLRFIKFAMKYSDEKRTQIMIVTTCMEMKIKTLFKMIKARDDIENSIFNNYKRECGLDHCYVHGGNAVEAILYLIFSAANIMQLFLLRRLRKQYKTQKEIVRLLIKGLYLLKYKSQLVFSSS